MNDAVCSAAPAIRLMGMTADELSTPFGLALGKTRIRDLEEYFVITCEQGTGFTKGPVFQVIPRYVEEPETECIVLAFDQSGTLDAAWFTVSADQYSLAVQAMSQTFELIDKNNPIKGSESALFRFVQGQVTLHAPLFSKEMTIGYRTDKFNDARMEAAATIFE